MKIQKFGSLKGGVTLSSIKHVTPFSFVRSDKDKIYIKVYPCTSYQGMSGYKSFPTNLCMVVDLEQGGITTSDSSFLVDLLDYDFKVTGERIK